MSKFLIWCFVGALLFAVLASFRVQSTVASMSPRAPQESVVAYDTEAGKPVVILAQSKAKAAPKPRKPKQTPEEVDEPGIELIPIEEARRELALRERYPSDVSNYINSVKGLINEFEESRARFGKALAKERKDGMSGSATSNALRERKKLFRKAENLRIETPGRFRDIQNDLEALLAASLSTVESYYDRHIDDEQLDWASKQVTEGQLKPLKKKLARL